MDLLFEAIDEDMPGAKWRRVFDRHWHAYSRWFIRDGVRSRPTYLASLKALREHMPELLPAYEAIVAAAGGGDLEARFLSMWCPPVYVGGCSQALVGGATPALIRNYDYSPRLFEGTVLGSRFNGKRVVAMVDCLWGALDGVNENGLCVSLSFGGRTEAGDGFGIPIVLRYVLEFATNTAEAIAILRRVPVHMSYSVALLDAGGNHATVYVNPDRPAEVLERRVSTNHQRRVEWQRHAETTRTVERAAALDQAVALSSDPQGVLAAFLQPPVYQTSYGHGYGTLYTAFYRPQDASVELIWPGQSWRHACSHVQEGVRTIRFMDESPVA
ncbi:acyl-coenzyme A:6-aminopenicillanic acid acyl-transferase [Variibacter gotjawalensis]|uniref:Acyl-coenzyme A:6-aminopenicillanic acid acyl-transferase n=1 Tax=Variibacter gotjawalensis TaxID=1333996 RepID=A0A0S3PT02_9BRAD|nr:C45 family peptidase [Variibacter gotjawalensis]NIK49410.1 putative choloylglycine hydrolase [Variibacter gotjawalensis]RZS51262.1 putative choloylglycine hydrolase [Variibacter gotjawalensis]BAT59095.1 acyl-coenzyme A:6-aminopenicillanic acid acyl-transferase [Variibacter gotjawalensis]